MGHESVIEHGNITIKIICDRACSHQVVRHRIAAYSQESQRWCDYDILGFKVICPPSVAVLRLGTYQSLPGGCWMAPYGRLTPGDGLSVVMYERACRWLHLRLAEYNEYCLEREEGVPPEDARSNLPNATKTELVATFNLRQWRHVFEHRALNRRAQWEIRYILQGVLVEFAGLLPAVFKDQAQALYNLKVPDRDAALVWPPEPRMD